MYEEIINEIKSNLGENKDLNKKYLSSQMDVYKNHPNNKEILNEISSMMWDCLSEFEKEEYNQIIENKTQLMDILNEVAYEIENGKSKVALEKLDKFINKYQSPFENDDDAEYHFFTNTLEELIFMRYIGSKNEIKYIPTNQPVLDLYYIYGFLLLEDNQFEKSEEYLKKAIKINPVSSRVILELSEIYKIHTYTYNKYYMFVSDALKYAYYPQDIARCYRQLGFYYIEENQMEIALALFIYSMEYELSPQAYSEINYIQSKNSELKLNLDECINIIKNKNIQLGVNPFVLDTLYELADEYEKNRLYSQSLYYYEIIYDLTNDENILEKIKNITSKINY
ncbi:hypothetical protein [Methanobrevibacter sp. UBA188]|uniref:hypothetical protein n=1 Tax=Methanobrevibacter sp. UBA188 TaxID=1915473 RepID=UPI0025FBDB28|nr:hypothetical protein [Methanobrevibacter sp. UBA188]